MNAIHPEFMAGLVKAGWNPEPRCFKIVRFYRDGRTSRTIKSNVTESEAQAHCHRPDTRKEGVYFDGYDYMKGCHP